MPGKLCYNSIIKEREVPTMMTAAELTERIARCERELEKMIGCPYAYVLADTLLRLRKELAALQEK